MAQQQTPVPRGRHAPPLEVRLEVQRQRLFDAAAAVFARAGYAEASAEAISREAGMSKATFYEHFANKEECILALADHGAERLLKRLMDAARAGGPDLESRHRAGIRAMLEGMAAFPDHTQSVIVELVGAGPRGMARRDQALQGFAAMIFAESKAASQAGLGPGYASEDETYAIAGAAFELISRQLRTGHPEKMTDLEPLIDRLIRGLLALPE